MYTTMAEASATSANTPLPFGQSYWDYLLDMIQDYILDMEEHRRDLEAQARHKTCMKDVCYQIHAHHYWESLWWLFPSSFAQQCWFCGETISPEFDMSRHMGLCELKERLADEAFDGPSAHDYFYSYTSPYISRSSYTSHLD